MSDTEYIDVQEVQLHGLNEFQQDKALIDSQIATAKRYPRDLKRCMNNAITLVTLDKDIAASCTYSLPKGGKNITGPSVVLAKILAKSLGNMRIDNRMIGADDTHVTCQATCFDLENNFAIRTTIKRSIVGSRGRYSEDMITIVGNAGNAIALRNAVFAVVDESVIKKVWESSKETVTGKIPDATALIARRTAVINGLKDTYKTNNLTDAEIIASIGKNSIEHITKDDIVTLIGFENSLKTGETTFESVFRPQINTVKPVAPKSEDKETERLTNLINNAKDKKTLETYLKHCNTQELRNIYDTKFKSL